MDSMILSLKNLYKLLMNNDFPIYSESVISKKNRKGQTLLRFWQDMLVSEFRCLPYGKMIWRNDGTRNRYISNLCNRNGELKYYHEYARELGAQINAGILLNQIQRFSSFLQDREYKNEILLYRVKEQIRFWDMDPCITDQIKTHIGEILFAVDWAERRGMQGRLFHAGYLLTVMTLYAAAGEAMNDPAMDILRDDAYSMDTLWCTYNRRRERGNHTASFLTAHCGLLQDNALSQDHFFGREEELFDLREMAAEGRKCLISGIGGVGKTEMLRQLIRWCCDEHTVDKIAVVPYQTDLAESLSCAFPTLRQQGREETFWRIVHQLEKEAQNGKVLLLVDDVTNGADGDTNLQVLAQLPCAVLVTSRRKTLDGFEVYTLKPPSVSTSTLIFRDNYGHSLLEEDRLELLDLLQEEGICHPLTLRLIARAAGSKNWSVAKLREHLRHSGMTLAWMEEERTVRFEQMYAQLYSLNRIPPACQEITELFTLLPQSSYSTAFLTKIFPDICAGEKNLLDSLKILTEGGWLDMDDSGYSMHPLIAQCLRRKTLTQARLEKILSCLQQKLPRNSAETVPEHEDYLRVCQILIYISRFLSGSVSADLMIDIMDAMSAQYPSRQLAGQYQKLLQQMLRRCPNQDDTVQVVWHTVLCGWAHDDEDAVENVFRRQQACLTVPVPRFLAFCISANSQLYKNRPELAEEMLLEVLKADASHPEKAAAYRELLTLYEYRGNSEAALHWGEIGVEYVTQHPECGELNCFDNIAGLAGIYLKFGQRESAKPLLDKMERLEKSIGIPSVTIQYLTNRGNYELYYGDLEYAQKAVEEALEVLDKYYGKSFNYYATLNQLAIILQRQKRYEEAKAAYEEILSYGKDMVYFNIARNNFSVLLLDMGKPEEAIPYLTQVLTLAREQGGIALGEAQRNMARAHGLLGEYAREYECLKEAAPLLEEAYGPDHPRSVAARERLEELAGQIK